MIASPGCSSFLTILLPSTVHDLFSYDVAQEIGAKTKELVFHQNESARTAIARIENWSTTDIELPYIGKRSPDSQFSLCNSRFSHVVIESNRTAKWKYVKKKAQDYIIASNAKSNCIIGFNLELVKGRWKGSVTVWEPRIDEEDNCSLLPRSIMSLVSNFYLLILNLLIIS